jgi:hypothetical protein
MAAVMLSGALNGVDDPEDLGRQEHHAHQNEKECPTSHRQFLLARTFVLVTV